MRNATDMRLSGSAPTTFDPFGEPLDAARCESPRDGRAHRVTAAVFWALALMLVGGRVYLADAPVAQTFAALADTVQAHIALR